MIRNCILFRVESSEWPQGDSAPRPGSLTFKRLAEQVGGTEKKRLKALEASFRDEKLAASGSTGEFWQYVFRGETHPRRPTSSADEEMPFVPTEFKVWLGKKSQWVVTFQAGRRQSRAAVSLLAHAIAGDARAIRSPKFTKRAFEELLEWVNSGEGDHAGHLARATMENVQSGRSLLRQLAMRANRLEGMPVFHELLSSATAVSNMTFLTPKLRSSPRGLLCKLTHWGGLTIYSTEPLEAEIEELLRKVTSLPVGGAKTG